MPEIKETPKPNPKPATSGFDAPPLNPFAYMRDMSREMSRFFEEFGMEGGFRAPSLFATTGLPKSDDGPGSIDWAPRIDVSEKNGELVVRADLPGLSKEDVQVELADDLLMIRGERKQEKSEERDGGYYSECRYGHFRRAIPLPDGVASDKAVASFKDGVLEIKMPAPRREQPASRRLAIR